MSTKQRRTEERIRMERGNPNYWAIESLRNELVDEEEESSKEDLAASLWEYLSDAASRIPEATIYTEEASRRNTERLTDPQTAFAEQALNDFQPEPNQCWANAQHMSVWYQDHLDYVEGVIASLSHPWPIYHAWVELDGKVVETTLENAPHVETDGVYIGKHYSMDEVRDGMDAAEALAFKEGLQKWKR